MNRIWLIIVCLLAFAMASCQVEQVPARQIFDDAENAYRVGNYEAAQAAYTQFLKLSPDPQLARLAERRLLSIDREKENVLGQKIGPKPIYVTGQSPASQIPTQQPDIFQSDSPQKQPALKR